MAEEDFKPKFEIQISKKNLKDFKELYENLSSKTKKWVLI